MRGAGVRRCVRGGTCVGGQGGAVVCAGRFVGGGHGLCGYRGGCTWDCGYWVSVQVRTGLQGWGAVCVHRGCVHMGVCMGSCVGGCVLWPAAALSPLPHLDLPLSSLYPSLVAAILAGGFASRRGLSPEAEQQRLRPDKPAEF